MSSGFPDGGFPGFYAADRGIINGRSTTPMMNNPQVPSSSPLLGIHRGTNLIGKRSHAELQQQQQPQPPYHQILQQQQQFQQMALHNLRNVKPRVNYQQSSPISPLSPGDFSSFSSVSAVSPEISSLSSVTNSPPMNPRYGLPNVHRINNLPTLINRNFTPPGNNFSSVGSISFPRMVQNQKGMLPTDQELLFSGNQPDKKIMMNRLQELEKQLLDDDENGNGTDAVSTVTNSEWSETIQNLNLMSTNHNPISPSPTSPSSSCSSTSASPLITCPKQSIAEAATAISDGKTEVASEILNRLIQVSNVKGTSEQRLTSYMASALRSRLNYSENSNSISELNSDKHALSTQMLYEVSPCFKLGFMAANLAILESISDQPVKKVHVIDFDIGQGGQYVHLLHGLGANKSQNTPAFLKISVFSTDQFVNGEDNRLKSIGDGLKALSRKIGVSLNFNAINLEVTDLNRENLGIEDDEALVVNFAFKLYKLPDESVTTENQRDELLRRVKSLSPTVVTLVEHEKNANTAAFVTRVKEEWEYNGALFDSLDATQSKESTDRVRIEEGLGRKICNSVTCEERDRQERTEVFGKWRARMRMAGFNLKPMSSLVADSLLSKLNSGTRRNPGFSVKEEFGGICFGWKGRTITVASAWR